jgi:menaquinone-specific isochorismate synthase
MGHCMMDVAAFRAPDGSGWLGHGPFTEHASQPAGPAFYCNSFDLADPRPWKAPVRCEPLGSAAELTAGAPPQIRWHKPGMENFKMIFRRIRRDVLAGRLIKMVPVVTEHGDLTCGDPDALLHSVLQAKHGGWGYARIQGETGFLGITPELLFESQGQHLRTMALAGTAKPGADAAFLTDVKEITEHEIVVRFIEDQLSPLGTTTRQERGLLQTAGLRHFHTPIHLDAASTLNADDLLTRLHPTPAVGCLPLSAETRSTLLGYRKMVDVPAHFGAPFGFSDGTRTTMVVSIRGLSWKGSRFTLPSGCGIVGGSAFDHEWRELRLKRQAVARMLGV